MKRLNLLLLVFLMLFFPAAARAQDELPPEVVVMHTSVAETNDGLQLSVFFTVRDESGRPVRPNLIRPDAGVILGDQVTARVEEPQTAIKLAIVLDESGSMQPFVEQVKAAAIDAVEKGPVQAEIAFFTFTRINPEDPFEPVVNFTKDKGSIQDAIASEYNSVERGETCLFNAAFRATEFLKQNINPEDRRAIILFTDGKDENNTDGAPCSDKNLSDVIEVAAPDEGVTTPIYTVGLCQTANNCGKLDVNTLGAIATRSRAISKTGSPDEIGLAFLDIMDDIKSQRVAKANVLPCEERTGTLLVNVINVDDGIPGNFTFSSDKCFAPRSTIELVDIAEVEKTNKFNLRLNINNRSPVPMTTVGLRLFGPSNTLVFSNTLEADLPPDNVEEFSTELPGARMTQSGKYILELTGFGPDGTPFWTQNDDDKKDEKLLFRHEFNHQAADTVILKINSTPEIDYTRDLLLIKEIEIIEGRELLLGKERNLNAQVLLKDQGTQVFESQLTTFKLESTSSDFGSLEIPLAQLPQNLLPTEAPKQFDLSIRFLAPDVQPSETEDFAFNFPPRPTQSFFQKYGLYLLGVLLAIVVGIALVFLVRNRGSKKAAEIPRPYNPPTQMLNRNQPQQQPPPFQQPGYQTPPPGYQQPGYQQQPPPFQQPGYQTPPPGYQQPGYQTPPPQPGYQTPPPQPGYQTPPPQQPSYQQQQPTQVGGFPVAGGDLNSATVVYPSVQPMQAQPPRLRVRVAQTPDPSQQREQMVASFPLRIGRGEEANFPIIGDVSISRVHAEITVRGTEFFITDLDSKNGVFINEERLEARKPIKINGRMMVRVGRFTNLELEPQV